MKCSIDCLCKKHKRENISGQKFGQLVAIKYVYTKAKMSYWLFRCDCGLQKIIQKASVKFGKIRSCGCYKKECNRIQIKKLFLTHGESKTSFYHKYCSINDRCNNPKMDNYKNYGGRGIKNEWHCYKEFRKDMYESYLIHVNQYGQKNTQIDRINPNRNYYKANCRWVTISEQAKNKRKKSITL